MATVVEFQELSEYIRRVPRPAIIAIEGFTGSGKSRLAGDLCETAVARAIGCDDYVIGEDESLPYVKRIDYDRLRSTIDEVAVAKGIALVEGICLRAVLRALNATPAVFIYVKCLATSGLWHDGFELEAYESTRASPQLHEPHRSDFAYHASERPHEHADFEFHRIEQ